MQANSDFEFLIPMEITVIEPPSVEEQRILREIDPNRMVLGK